VPSTTLGRLNSETGHFDREDFQSKQGKSPCPRMTRSVCLRSADAMLDWEFWHSAQPLFSRQVNGSEYSGTVVGLDYRRAEGSCGRCPGGPLPTSWVTKYCLNGDHMTTAGQRCTEPSLAPPSRQGRNPQKVCFATRKAKSWTSLQSDWHLHLRALPSARPAGRLNVSWPSRAGRWRHEAVLRAGHDIAYAPCRLARKRSFLCRRKG
jgi:hypothetical protein